MSGVASPLAKLLDEPLGLECKPFAPELAGTQLGAIGDLGLRLGDPRLLLPCMLLRDDLLQHNVDTMARYCADRGLALAPHGKTTMAPQIFERQLAAGAWGLTAATAGQAAVMHAFGVRRILIANQLVSASALRWAARAMAAHDELELLCLVDSVEAVAAMNAGLRAEGATRPIGVLVEIGVPGKRTGARRLDVALDVARAAAQSSSLAVAGVECFEGVLGASREPEVIASVDALLGDMMRLAVELEVRGLATDDQGLVLSAGGSVFFDRLAPMTELRVSTPPIVLARSGCYVTHDDGTYDRVSPLGRRATRGPRLQAALTVWGEVLSTPETGLAIVNLGKRDAPFDSGLPRPRFVLRAGADAPEEAGDLDTTALNDQHAFVRGDAPPRVGDLVGFGISHPCTAFDKWRVVATCDAGGRITGAMRTFF